MQARQKLKLCWTGLLFFTVITYTSFQNQKEREAQRRTFPEESFYYYSAGNTIQFFPVEVEAKLSAEFDSLKKFSKNRWDCRFCNQLGEPGMF